MKFENTQALSQNKNSRSRAGPEPDISDGFAAFIEERKASYQGSCLLFDLKRVKQRIRGAKVLEKNFNCRFLFAVKACPDPEILRLFRDEDIGFDISNQQEYDRVIELGDDLKTCLISATGPAMAFTDPPQFVDLFNIESRAQLAALHSMMPQTARFAFRLRGESLKTDSIDKLGRFGLTEIENDLLTECRKDRRFGGLHCSRSGRKLPTDFVRQAQYLCEVADQIGFQPEFINLGAGSDLLTHETLEQLLTEIRQFLPHQTEILFEFGSYWFAGAGVAITQVISSSSQADDIDRLVVDISKAAHLRWSLIDRVLSDEIDATEQTIRLDGPTCLESDILTNLSISRRQDTPIEVGDKLVLFPLDIYSLNWNSSFNGIPEAKVIFYDL